jgi:hypothetical protein
MVDVFSTLKGTEYDQFLPDRVVTVGEACTVYVFGLTRAKIAVAIIHVVFI